MAAQNMIMVDKLLAYLDTREQASDESYDSMDEDDPVRKEELAILDTITLIRDFVKMEAGQ